MDYPWFYLADQAVVAIEIAVDDAPGVEVGHARGDVLGEGDALLPGQRLGVVVQQTLQRPAGHVLGDQVQPLLLVQHADEAQHVAVAQTPHHGHLSAAAPIAFIDRFPTFPKNNDK